MDLGCYSIQWARFAAGSDPEVVSAEAVCPVDGVDGSLVAELRWPSGVTGRVGSSMIAAGDDVDVHLRVVGERGEMLATNPLAPQNGGALLTVETDAGKVTHEVDSLGHVLPPARRLPRRDRGWRAVPDHRRRRCPQHGDHRRLLPRRRSRAPPVSA